MESFANEPVHQPRKIGNTHGTEAPTVRAQPNGLVGHMTENSELYMNYKPIEINE